jgi:hypothetical protein
MLQEGNGPMPALSSFQNSDKSVYYKLSSLRYSAMAEEKVLRHNN